MWGLGNEVYSTDPGVAALLRELQAVAEREDPTRPTIYAHCCQADDDPKAVISDLIGFNRYFGWYTHDEQTLGKWIDQFHGKFPDKRFFVSEYGAGASIRHQEDPPKIHPTDGPFHPEQAQTLYHEQNWQDLRTHKGPMGSYIWVGIDLASDGRAEGDRAGINDKGLVTYDRKTRKDAYYFYKAHWSEKPVLYITSRRHELRTSPDIEVKVYANRGPVTLRVNGETMGTKEPQDRIARWQGIKLRPGRNSVEVSAADGSDTLVDRVIWTYADGPSVMIGPEPSR
jgi:beta-galactosidase